MIKAIIFDFAGVIGTDVYWVWLEGVVPDIEKKRSFFQELSNKADRGTITLEEDIETLSRETGVAKENIWEQIYQKIVINSDLVAYIKELKKKYKIGLLSNYTYQWLEDILQRYKLSVLFDTVVISSRHKVLKPEPKAFYKMLEQLGITKEEAIFIDDRDGHVDASNKLGLKAFLYTTNEKLKKDLEIHGIKT